MLNPMMPEDVSSKEIPRQRWESLLEVFCFKKFQGIALVRRLHIIGQAVNVLFTVIAIISSFWVREANVILTIIFFPIFMVVQAFVIRVIAELAVSVLLVPYMLMNNQQGAGGGRTVATDDLTAVRVNVEERETILALSLDDNGMAAKVAIAASDGGKVKERVPSEAAGRWRMHGLAWPDLAYSRLVQDASFFTLSAPS
eukprot:jgi/Undpi1/9216/HiC_scaffold_26.g11674.m1